jgi:ATP:ADP antiporter, AAA family
LTESTSTSKPATLLAAMASFCVLASYYLIRPIRDELSAEYADDLAKLWTYTGIVSLAIMPVYTTLVSRTRANRLAPRVYLTVAAALIIFAAFFAADFSTNTALLDKTFYVLSSLYALFVVSVLWSTLTSTFSSDASKKHAGRVFAAGTVGGITGSAIVSGTALTAPPEVFLVGSAILILPAAWALGKLAQAPNENDTEVLVPSAETGANLAAQPSQAAAELPVSQRLETGFRRVLQSPYLIGICLYLLLFVFGSSFLYFLQKDILRQFVDRGERRVFLGRIDFAVQTLTVLTQFLFTGEVIRRWGMGITLIVVPVVTVIGFTSLALAPTLWVLVGLIVLRRATNYALAKPAREILYTVVSREERYLTKPLLDVGLYRFGDLAAAWFYEGMKAAMSAGISGMAWLAVPFGAAAIPVGRWLGRKQEELADEKDGSAS